MVNRKFKVITSIIFVMVIAISGYYGYQYGIRSGRVDGYQNGANGRAKEYYSIGENEGYRYGYDTGHIAGYGNGLIEGWDNAEFVAVHTACGDMPSLTPPTSLYVEPSPVDPTYSQLIEFLNSDDTKNLEYSDDFTCWGFAITLKRNAEKQGIKCAVVSLTYKDEIDGKPVPGHVINMFKVTDPPLEGYNIPVKLPNGDTVSLGWRLMAGSPYIYVDPQHGNIMRYIAIGGSYEWYVDFSMVKYEDEYDKGLNSYGGINSNDEQNEIIARIRANNVGIPYVHTVIPRYIGEDDEIHRYIAGPFVEAHDNISKMSIIW